MGYALHVKTIRMANGSRRAMLCERSTGVPLANPTLYITTCVYLAGREYNTQVSILSAIHFLYIWADKNGVDLEKTFKAGTFLNLQQVEGLVRDARMNLRQYVNDPLEMTFGGGALSSQPRYRRHRPRRKAQSAMFNKDNTTIIRLSYVRAYLEWLANTAISMVSAKKPEYEAIIEARQGMLNAIGERVPGKGVSRLRRGFTKEERAKFLEVIDPKSPQNPFKSEFVRARNHIVGHMLFHLGCRRGELLLIKEKDIDWNPGNEGGPTVGLRDHPLDPEDTRRVRPQFKTRERRLPLSRTLARLVKKYIQRYRDRIPGARSHGYLLVGREGKPLSLSSVDDIFRSWSLLEGLPDDLSTHTPRYDWNEMFSEKADRMIAEGQWTVEDEKLIRRYHQGWVDDSLMPSLYARRHIERKAKITSLELQRDYLDDDFIVGPDNARKLLEGKEDNELK